MRHLDSGDRVMDIEIRKLDLLGAIVAHIIYVSSIITFMSRLLFGVQPGHWIGMPILLMAFPLAYLL